VRFRINSIPTGASVKIGSKVMGITPTTFEIAADDSGEATVELTLEAKGYQTITFIATSPEPRFDLVQRLQKGSGRVQLAKLASAKQEDSAVVLPMTLPVEPATALAKAVPAALAPSAPVPVEQPAPAAEPEPVKLAAVAAPAKVAGPAAGRIYSSDELTSRPRLLEAGRPPRYTESARVVRSEGTAVARCVVSVKGHLEECRMVKSVPLMDEEILKSLGTRLYEPGRVAGEPVASEIKVVLRVEAR